MRNLIVRPVGLGDILLMGITISSIKKKYKDDIFDLVVLSDYDEIARIFLSVNKVHTIPSFYFHYYGKHDELFKRHKNEFEGQYDNIINWQDEAIEVYRNKNDVSRVDLFIANSPYKDVSVNISDVKMQLFSKYNYNRGKKLVGVCMTSVSLYRSFDESNIIETIKSLLDAGYIVIHFGLRKLSRKIDHPDFNDIGCSLQPLPLFKMVSGLDFLVTVDTVAFHMATLLDVPYLAFFGEVNARLRTSHLNKINGQIVCNNDLDCVRGECVFCNERPCLNDYKADWILEKVNEFI